MVGKDGWQGRSTRKDGKESWMRQFEIAYAKSDLVQIGAAKKADEKHIVRKGGGRLFEPNAKAIQPLTEYAANAYEVPVLPVGPPEIG